MLLWLSFVLIDMKLSTVIDILMHWSFRFWLTWKWRVAFDVNIFSWSYILGKLLLFPVVQCLLSYFLFESWVWDIKYFLAIKVSRFTHGYYVRVQLFSSSFLTTSFVCIRAVISSLWCRSIRRNMLTFLAKLSVLGVFATWKFLMFLFKSVSLSCHQFLES